MQQLNRPIFVTVTKKVGELDIFYREAGDPAKPVLVLLHGFPTSSHMYREVLQGLSDSYYLIAPDYPGFGNSSFPSPDTFAYTFDHLAEIMGQFLEQRGLKRYSLMIQDYGAPIGFPDCQGASRTGAVDHYPERQCL